VEFKKEISVLRYLLWLLLAVMVSGCAAYTATSGQVVLKDDSKTADVRLSPDDLRVIGEYYRNRADRKAAASPVKPVMGHVIPTGTKSEPLPRELEQKLSSLSSSYARVRIGRDIVLINSNTRVVVDVFHGAAN
jgi:hypothetical protein